MSNRWPQEIDRAIADAVVAGVPTSRILAGIRDGSLDGLSGGYSGYPDRTFYDALARVRGRLRTSYAPPKSEQGDFLRKLAEEERRDGDAGGDEEGPGVSPADPEPGRPQPVETRDSEEPAKAAPVETREQRMARVIREIEALAAEAKDAEQRKLGQLTEQLRREDEARPRVIPMREALDQLRAVEPPGRRNEPEMMPDAYLPRSMYDGPHRPGRV
jgi:hypothetical protein